MFKSPAQVDAGHDDYYGITIPLNTSLEVVAHGRSELFFPAEGHVRNCSDAFDVRVGDRLDVMVVNLDKPLLCDYLHNLEGGETSDPPRFGPRLSLLSPSGSSFWRYLSFIWSELGRGGSIGASTLIQQELENTLVAMLFHTLQEQAVDTRQHDAGRYPTALRVTEDYIMAHLADPVSIADLSEVSGVSSRTLFKMFQERHGMGPIGFLKVRRLEAVHRALLAADPQGTTVTEVAMGFGFFHLGHFSRDYRQAFQELPSETLRHGFGA